MQTFWKKKEKKEKKKITGIKTPHISGAKSSLSIQDGTHHLIIKDGTIAYFKGQLGTLYGHRSVVWAETSI